MRVGDVDLQGPGGDALKYILGLNEWNLGVGAYLECVHRKLSEQLERPDTDDRESLLLRGEIRFIKKVKRLQEFRG